MNKSSLIFSSSNKCIYYRPPTHMRQGRVRWLVVKICLDDMELEEQDEDQFSGSPNRIKFLGIINTVSSEFLSSLKKENEVRRGFWIKQLLPQSPQWQSTQFLNQSRIHFVSFIIPDVGGYLLSSYTFQLLLIIIYIQTWIKTSSSSSSSSSPLKEPYPNPLTTTADCVWRLWGLIKGFSPCLLLSSILW